MVRGGLLWGSFVVMLLHMTLSFTRHIFSPENNMQASPGLTLMMRVDEYLAMALGAAALIYVFVSFLCRRRAPGAWAQTRHAVRRYFSPESFILIGLFVWYLVCLVVYGDGTFRRIHGYWRYVTDLGICLLLLFPLPRLVGIGRIRIMANAVFHTAMAVSTAFTAYALLAALSGAKPVWPFNGLTIQFRPRFYPAMNANIFASVSFSAALIALYMIIAQKNALRWVYTAAFILHLAATLLTGSRGHFFALLAVLALTVFMVARRFVSGKALWKKLLAAALPVGAAVALLFLLRRLGILAIAAVRNTTASSASRSLIEDSGRLPIWAASLRMMVSSVKEFFFGIPIGDFPTRVKTVMTELFGRGSRMAHAHNLILQVGVILGVPAMLAFIAFLALTAIRCVRVFAGRGRQRMEGGWFLPVAILGTMIVNMFEPFNMLYISLMGCLFFLFSGWVMALDRGDACLQP